MLLVVGGIKGGTGKTTIATNLAVCRASLGKRVLLIDADEQKSALDWSFQRIPDLPLTVSFDGGCDLHKRLDKGFYEDIIVDTGGRDTTSQRSALSLCDAFLMPLRPRSLDIWTVNTLNELKAEIRQINSVYVDFCVFNQCEPRGSDKSAARDLVVDSGMNVLKTELGYRKAFSDASSQGLGVIELSTSDIKSQKEVMALHDEIYSGNMLHTFKPNRNNVWLYLKEKAAPTK